MILAIESGSDWADASVAYLLVSGDFNCCAARKLYSKFEETLPKDWPARKGKWMCFSDWLLKEGLATVPYDKDLIVDDLDYG